MNKALRDEYIKITVALLAFSATLRFVITSSASQAAIAASAQRLVAPVCAMAALTGVVFVLMVLSRNIAVIRGQADVEYYRTYTTHEPPEWIERPARTFMNLLEAPMLFYVVCILMLITQRSDDAQLKLAWLYVGTRVLHAIVYMGWNYVPYRFGTYIASNIVLGVIWARFALM